MSIYAKRHLELKAITMSVRIQHVGQAATQQQRKQLPELDSETAAATATTIGLTSTSQSIKAKNCKYDNYNNSHTNGYQAQWQQDRQQQKQSNGHLSRCNSVSGDGGSDGKNKSSDCRRAASSTDAFSVTATTSIVASSGVTIATHATSILVKQRYGSGSRLQRLRRRQFSKRQQPVETSCHCCTRLSITARIVTKNSLELLPSTKLTAITRICRKQQEKVRQEKNRVSDLTTVSLIFYWLQCWWIWWCEKLVRLLPQRQNRYEIKQQHLNTNRLQKLNSRKNTEHHQHNTEYLYKQKKTKNRGGYQMVILQYWKHTMQTLLLPTTLLHLLIIVQQLIAAAFLLLGGGNLVVVVGGHVEQQQSYGQLKSELNLTQQQLQRSHYFEEQILVANNNNNSTNTSSMLQGLTLALSTYSNSNVLANEPATSSIGTKPYLLQQQSKLGKIISRDNLLKNVQENKSNFGTTLYAPNDKSNEIPISSRTASSSCSSCQQLREKAKQENLESIKMHILRRLQLTQLPNITAPIPVPQNIIENFYKNYNASISSGGSSLRAATSIIARGNMAWQHQQQFSAAEEYGSVDEANIGDSDMFSSDLSHNDEAKHKMMQSDQPHSHQHQHQEQIESQILHNANGGDRSASGDSIVFKNLPLPQLQSKTSQPSSQHQQQNVDIADAGEEDSIDFEMEDYYSRVNSVYLFPTISHLRHNHKMEILNFKYDDNHSMISRVILHTYIRGRDWLKEQNNNNYCNGNNRDITISIHRAIRHPNTMNYTHTIKLMEAQLAIPSGLGHWTQLEIPLLAQYWSLYSSNNNNNTSSNSGSLGLVIRGQESWMRPLIVTGNNHNGGRNKLLTTHIEVITEHKTRRKRSTSLDCQESDHEVRCCRYPLKVNFTNFGWNFVVAPTSFDAYFCNGECKVGYLEQYTHTHIASLSTSASPCCSPTKMSPLMLLYFNKDQNLVLSTIPNMSVEKCSCS